MKTILLSFKPHWFQRIIDGEKIFEYRNSFPDEEITAYMYVSSPKKAIIGKLHLGKRIKLEDLKDKYKSNIKITNRINHYINRYRFVMPIKSVQLTKEIRLEELRTFDEKFVCPQMYYFLDKKPELLEYIKTNATYINKELIHDFKNLKEDDICRIYSSMEE